MQCNWQFTEVAFQVFLLFLFEVAPHVCGSLPSNRQLRRPLMTLRFKLRDPNHAHKFIFVNRFGKNWPAVLVKQNIKLVWPYSQALRIRRICSGLEDYHRSTSELKSHLVNRGYDERKIQHQIDRATNTSRSMALESHEKNPIERVTLVVTYHPDLPPLNKILCDHLSTLHTSEKMKLYAARL